jgi:aspartate/glutamate racemase
MTTNTLDEYLEDVVYYIIQEIQQQDDNDEEIEQEIYAFRDDNILDDNKIYFQFVISRIILNNNVCIIFKVFYYTS